MIHKWSTFECLQMVSKLMHIGVATSSNIWKFPLIAQELQHSTWGARLCESSMCDFSLRVLWLQSQGDRNLVWVLSYIQRGDFESLDLTRHSFF